MAESEVGIQNQEKVPDQQFATQRLYIKDFSFESPLSPTGFIKEWKPSISVDLNTKSNRIDDTNVEVVLTITVEAKQEEDVAFLVEVQQAGIFFIKGIEGLELGRVLGAVCPAILFPYARETIDGVVIKGSFPALMLAPVNFDALYEQALSQDSKEQSTH
tara:strand:- start:1103 stop:1582 length:480 start_codon:yes stop_codon:yes gene_type:complete